MSQNELAIQFFNAGFFDPARAQQALLCLDMMDFDRKNLVIKALRDNSFDPLSRPVQLPALAVSKADPMTQPRSRVAEATAPR